MKKLWLIIAAVAAASAVGFGATLALFSDSTSSTNTFTAGTLCLDSERDDGDTVPGPMFYVTATQGQTPAGDPGIYPTGVWAPGDEHTRTLTVYNGKSCPSMNAWLTSVQAAPHAGGYLPMADKLWVELYTPQLGVDVKIGEGWMSDFFAAPVPVAYPGGAKVPLFKSSNRHMKFKVKFDLTADNSYQDKTLIVDFTVNAVQMPNNP